MPDLGRVKPFDLEEMFLPIEHGERYRGRGESASTWGPWIGWQGRQFQRCASTRNQCGACIILADARRSHLPRVDRPGYEMPIFSSRWTLRRAPSQAAQAEGGAPITASQTAWVQGVSNSQKSSSMVTAWHGPSQG